MKLWMVMSHICYFKTTTEQCQGLLFPYKTVLCMDYARDICGAWNYKHTAASLRVYTWLPWLPCDSESCVTCINV